MMDKTKKQTPEKNRPNIKRENATAESDESKIQQSGVPQSKRQRTSMSKVPISDATLIKTEFVKREHGDGGDGDSSANPKRPKHENTVTDTKDDVKDISVRKPDPESPARGIGSDDPEQSTESALEHGFNERIPLVKDNDWSFFLETGLFSDVVLDLGNRQFRVHKIIVSGRSPVLADRIETDFLESRENRIELTDVEVEVFEQLLHYIYSGKVEALEQNAEELLIAADKYALYQLKSQCEQFLISEITIETVADLLRLAHQHSAHSLKIKAFEFILSSDEKLQIDLKNKNPQLFNELVEFKDRNK